MKTALLPIFSISLLLILAFSSPPAAAQSAVDVTITADDTTLSAGQTATIQVYARIAEPIRDASSQIFSWAIAIQNSNPAAVAGYSSVQTPAADNDPATSSDGTVAAGNLTGIFDTFLLSPQAGKAAPVLLVQFDVTAQAAGSSTFTVAPGATPGGLADFLVSKIGGGAYTGGNYSAASLTITAEGGGGGPDLSALNLAISRDGSNAAITFTPLAGFDHTIESTLSLNPAAWTSLPAAPHNTGAATQPIAPGSTRFYRLRLTPR